MLLLGFLGLLGWAYLAVIEFDVRLETAVLAVFCAVVVVLYFAALGGFLPLALYTVYATSLIAWVSLAFRKSLRPTVSLRVTRVVWFGALIVLAAGFWQSNDDFQFLSWDDMSH